MGKGKMVYPEKGTGIRKKEEAFLVKIGTAQRKE